MLNKFRTSEKGFTLIELLIVVAIIGILAAIAIPQFGAYRARGYSATINSDAKNAYTAAQAIIADSPAAPLAADMTAAKLQAAGYTQSALAVATMTTYNSPNDFLITIAPAGAAVGKVTDATIDENGILSASKAAAPAP